MILTPAIKGQLTKAINANTKNCDVHTTPQEFRQRVVVAVKLFFMTKMKMPKQQAKHATRRYLATLAA